MAVLLQLPAELPKLKILEYSSKKSSSLATEFAHEIFKISVTTWTIIIQGLVHILVVLTYWTPAKFYPYKYCTPNSLLLHGIILMFKSCINDLNDELVDSIKYRSFRIVNNSAVLHVSQTIHISGSVWQWLIKVVNNWRRAERQSNDIHVSLHNNTHLKLLQLLRFLVTYLKLVFHCETANHYWH